MRAVFLLLLLLCIILFNTNPFRTPIYMCHHSSLLALDVKLELVQSLVAHRNLFDAIGAVVVAAAVASVAFAAVPAVKMHNQLTKSQLSN